MTRWTLCLMVLAFAFLLTFAVGFGLTQRVDAAFLSAIFDCLYKYLVPLIIAGLASSDRGVVLIFAALAALWAVVRGFTSSFVEYRSGGFVFFEAGRPTLTYFVFEFGVIALICVFIYQVQKKYG